MASTREKLEFLAYRYPILERCFNCLCILACPFTLPWYCLTRVSIGCGNAKRDARRRKFLLMSTLMFEERAKTVNRRKSLSVGQSASGPMGLFRRKNKTLHQNQSILFAKLPAELRMRIWEMTMMETGAVHITTDSDSETSHRFSKSSSFPCHREGDPAIWHEDCFEQSWLLSRKIRPRDQIPPNKDTMSLLRTCRVIYTEALPILYSKTHFIFHECDHLVNFASTTPAAHLQRIRSLSLFYFYGDYRYWSVNHLKRSGYSVPTDRIATVLACMPNLRKVYLRHSFGHYCGTYSDPEIAFRDAEWWFGSPLDTLPEECEKYVIVEAAKELHSRRVRAST